MTEPSFWKRSVSRFGRSKSGSTSSKGDDEDLRITSGSASGRAGRGGQGKGNGEGGQAAFKFVEEGSLGKSKSPEGATKNSDPEQTPKEKRRAQVRKAQIEHRQRFVNHGKDLEYQIIVLREKIAQTETQAVLFKHENIAMKTALQSSLIPLPLSLRSQSQNLNPNTNTNIDLDLMDLDLDFTSPAPLSWSNNTTLVRTTFDPFLDGECLQISPAGSFPLSVTSTSSAGIYTAPDLSFLDTSISLPSPDIFNSKNWKPAVLAQQERENVYQQQQMGGESVNAGAGKVLSDEEMEMLAINFILALEHPCRKHFSPPSTDPFDSAPSGHELMATTHLFSHVSSFTLPTPSQQPHPHPQHQDSHNPPFPLHNSPKSEILSSPPNTSNITTTTKTNLPKSRTSNQIPIPPQPLHQPSYHPNTGASPGSTWLIPSPTLQSLYLMSESMPKENWEITPVQAWFLLEGRYGWERLLGKQSAVTVSSSGEGSGGGVGLAYGGEGEGGHGAGERVLDALKKGLAKLVTCLDFGSVIDENGFWGVVRSVLGEDGGSEWV